MEINQTRAWRRLLATEIDHKGTSCRSKPVPLLRLSDVADYFDQSNLAKLNSHRFTDN